MAQQTGIEWTDHTFNPWWGCTKVSPGCANCYAETWALRYGHNIWGQQTHRRTFGKQHWHEPIKWNRLAAKEGRRVRVFCASMADVFEDNPDIESERGKLWSLMHATPMLDWLLLTKRPENMRRIAPWKDNWPLNVWAMTSVEDQKRANHRVPILIQVPAQVRGLSVEPLLGPVNLTPWLKQIQWVIVGGESGRGARPMNPDWVRSIRDQCVEAGVAFFFKQWGEWAPAYGDTNVLEMQSEANSWLHQMQRLGKKASGRTFDGQTWNDFPHTHCGNVKAADGEAFFPQST